MQELIEMLNRPTDDTYCGLTSYCHLIDDFDKNRKTYELNGLIECMMCNQKLFVLLKQIALGDNIRPNEILDTLYKIVADETLEDLEEAKANPSRFGL